MLYAKGGRNFALFHSTLAPRPSACFICTNHALSSQRSSKIPFTHMDLSRYASNPINHFPAGLALKVAMASTFSVRYAILICMLIVLF